MITPKGGVFVKTPTYTAEENVRIAKTDALLDENLTLKGNYTARSYGLQYDENYRLEYQGEKDKQLYYKKKWYYQNGLDISNIQFKNNKDSIVFTEKFVFKNASYSSKAGDKILLNPNIFNQLNTVPTANEKRSLPMEIRRGYSYNNETHLQLPDNYTLESLFDAFELKSPFGNYKISITQKGKMLEYKRELVLFSGHWPKEEFSHFVLFMKQIAKKDKSKIIITKNL